MKIDDPFERNLSYLADKYEFWKILYVLFYKIVSYKYYKKGVELANVQINRQWVTIDEEIIRYLKRKVLVRVYYKHLFKLV